MKNRLQFNRIPKLFRAEDILVSGTTTHVSGRELAYEALSAYTTQRDFIPLIGEPIVARYFDDKGKKQAILAIGKATGATPNDTYGIEYHIIDTARMDEQISAATESAVTALDLASAATQSVNNYFVILRNMIEAEGIDLDNGSYFDDDDPTKDPSTCGKYKPLENSNYLDDAKNVREATWLLDQAIGQVSGDVIELSAVTVDIEEDLGQLQDDVDELSAVTAEFSASTFNELNDIKDDVAELSAVTESFSGHTAALIDNIINGAGLENDGRGTYPGHDETHIIKDATSLDNADVLLDRAIWDVSGSVIELSANTVAGLQDVLDQALDAVDELSANTMAADEALDDKIEELSGNTSNLINNIIESGGLNEDGTYPHPHEIGEPCFIGDATSLYDADLILDTTLCELSANTEAADNALNDKINELSANTMAADQVLQDQIDDLAGRKVLGVSAITTEQLENDDWKVSLVINEEDDKVLTQNTLGLKANLSLVYSSEDKKIYLKGKNDMVISEVDAKAFIKDGMLSAASVFTATEEDHQQYPELVVGKTYIKLLFNVDGEEPGRANPVFISAEDLVDTYTVAPESHTFMEINDYVIKLNVDVADGLASYNYARNISAVTANIISATGLNMGEQGGYPGHDETHYIKNAGSLDQADVLLDEAIWHVSGSNLELSASVVNNENVINNILKGTGLNTDEPGEYHGHDETHYIKDATSLDNADVLLDAAIWNMSGVVGDLSANTMAADQALDDRIDELSGVTEEFSGTTHILIQNILSGTGLNIDGPGSYPGHDETHYIKDANSLDNADVILDAALWQLSGVVADINIEELEEKIDNLSAVTQEFSATTNILIQELSARTVDLEPVYRYIDQQDAILSGRCDELDERVTYIEDHFTGEFIPLTNYIISSAETFEELEINSGDTVNIAFGKIQKQILDNELVTAAALNDLDERIRNSTGVSELSAVVMSFSAATYNKFNDVDINITNLGDDITELSAATINLSAATTAISENLTILSSVTSALSVDIKELSAGTIQLSADTHNTIKELSAATMTISGNLNYLSAAVIDNELVTAAALNDLDLRLVNLSAVTITGVSIDGVAQPVVDHVANLNITIPPVNSFFDGVEYDSNTKKINFYNGTTLIDFVDATDFIKDGMLNNVEVVTISGETYLRFTFNTDAGKEAIDIRVSDFAALYEAGSGITIESDNTIRVKLANKGDVDYLKLDGDGLYLSGITSLAGNVNNLSGSVVSLSADVRALSAACVTMSGDIANNRTDINVLSANMIVNELVVAAACNDLDRRIKELSGNTPDLSNYYTKNEVYNKPEIDAMIGGGGTNALTGVTMNGSAVSVTNNVANLGTVITAEAQLSTAVTGNGNVFSTIQVSNHKITMGKNFTAATKANLDALSGAVQNNYYTTANTYNKTEVNNLISGATLRKYQTASTLTNLDFQEFLTIVKISGNTTLSIASSGLPVLPANGVAERHVIIENTGNTDAVVTISSDARVKLTLNDKIAIDRNGIGELNALITYDGSAYTIYVITT